MQRKDFFNLPFSSVPSAGKASGSSSSVRSRLEALVKAGQAPKAARDLANNAGGPNRIS